LFTTLISFDAVYHGHFKCNREKWIEFHYISNYVDELYQVPGVKGTVDLQYTKIHYYASHLTINATRIVPLGTGILHSEYNRTNKPLTFYQIWLESDKYNVIPRWESKKFPSEDGSALTLLVSGYPTDKSKALFINQET
jgi:hypothetical protein